MQDAFSNFLHMGNYKCGISTLQLASLFIWIAVSAVTPALHLQDKKPLYTAR